MRTWGLLLAGLACIVSATTANASTQPTAIVAHRGLSEGAPENTIAALRQSVDRGIPIIELDVRATQDGHLVILHDETLDRTTDCSGRLAATPLASLKACDAGWPSHPGEPIPTLAEALDFTASRPIRLLLDIKPGINVASVLNIVRDRGAETRVVLGLRRSVDIARARTHMPAISILAFLPNVADAREFASAGANIIRLWSDWVEADRTLVSRTGALGPQVWIMIGKRLPRGEPDWRSLHSRMIAAGAQGLITDRPELISAP